MTNRLNDSGYETLDPTPVEIPTGFRKPELLAETIQRLIRNDVSQIADKEGYDTFEEADDFHIEDDDSNDPSTVYETVFDPVIGRDVTAQSLMDNRDHYKELYEEAIKEPPTQPDDEHLPNREPGTGESEAEKILKSVEPEPEAEVDSS